MPIESPLRSFDQPTYQHAWQSQLLAEMGINRWVSQASPVIELSEDFLYQPVSEHDVSQDLTQKLYQFNDVLTTHNPSDTDVYFTDNTVDNLPTRTAQPTAPPDEQAHERFGTSQPAIDLSLFVPSAVVQSFVIQAIFSHNWVLLVDEKTLQTDTRQAKLWQQIQNQLKVTAANFRFPLMDGRENLPKTAIQQMYNAQMAMAGFSGFMWRLTQNRHIQMPIQYQLGSLTSLPECLDSQPIQRLPYLNEMVEDYRLKRQLWRVLNNF